MYKFKVGDQFYVTTENFEGGIMEITSVREDHHYPYRVSVIKIGSGSRCKELGDTGSNWRDDGDMYLINNKNKTMAQKIGIFAKKLLDSNTQTLLKAGYIDSNLELTAKGKSNLDLIAFQTNMTALVAMATEELAEEDANNK